MATIIRNFSLCNWLISSGFRVGKVHQRGFVCFTYLILTLTFIININVSVNAETKNVIKDPRCYQTPDGGLCRAYFIKYAYNPEINKCYEFVYGGCGGVVPFNKLAECQKLCEVIPTIKSTPSVMDDHYIPAPPILIQ